MFRHQAPTRVVLFVSSVIAIGCSGGSDGATSPGVTPVASVVIEPQTATVVATQTVQLTATVKDATGQALTGRQVAWSASPSDRASVSTTGLVTGLAPGAVTITATSEGKSGNAQVTVSSAVASVEISSANAVIVPEQTLQLTAVVKDAGGAVLNGQQVTWHSSQSSVATVSGTGLVTAITPGVTTISATSSGKSGTIDVTVEDGVVVGPAGRTVTSDGGNVEITIPAGAVSSPTPITVTKLPQPTVSLPANVHMLGAVYRLGPAGLSFTQPVTIRLKYPRNQLPAWAMSGDLSLQRNAAGVWGSLSDITVDGQANTVSGKTTAFAASGARAPFSTNAMFAQDDDGSEIALQALNPHAVFTPATGSVNFQQRAVTFRVSLEPRGAGLPPAEVTQQAGNAGLVKYRWSTTGQNGVLGSGGTSTGWTTQAEMQYVATNPVLNQLSGPIDNITVEVLLNPANEGNPQPRDITTTSATIDADLQLTYEIAPDDKELGRGEQADFQLRIRHRQGNTLGLPQQHTVDWESSANHGSIPGNLSPTQTSITYTANSTFNTAPPRVDDIRARINTMETITERVPVWGGLLGLQLLEVRNETRQVPRQVGQDTAYATVKVDYAVTIAPSTSTLAPGATKVLEVSLDPDEIPVGNLVYRFVRTGSQGTLSVENNVQTSSRQVTYTASTFPSGGTDEIEVEVFSTVAGVVLESIGKATASVEVDLYRATFSIFTQPTPAHAEGFVAARISITKVPGASQYEVTATTPDGPYSKTFSGAESSDPRAIGQVIDGGTVWHINLEAGFATTDQGVNGRKNVYNTKYGGVVFKVKVTQ